MTAALTAHIAATTPPEVAVDIAYILATDVVVHATRLAVVLGRHFVPVLEVALLTLTLGRFRGLAHTVLGLGMVPGHRLAVTVRDPGLILAPDLVLTLVGLAAPICPGGPEAGLIHRSGRVRGLIHRRPRPLYPLAQFLARIQGTDPNESPGKIVYG